MENQEKKLNNQENIENLSDQITLKNKEIKNLEMELLKNQNKINDIQLRKLASIENIKKNTEQEIQEIKNIQLKKFFQKTIQIFDSLEKIVETSNELNIKHTPLIKGIELTLQSLLNIFNKSGVQILGKKNEIFNPNIHESIMIKKSKKIPSNHIISVHKKGFIFNHTILRKAMVVISQN